MNININHLFSFVTVAVLLAAGCKKDVSPLPGSSGDGLISFINLSAQTDNQRGYSYVLVDRADTLYKPVVVGFADQPYFAVSNSYQYPNTYFNNTQQQEWINYMHLKPGSHTFIFIDTAHYLRKKDNVSLVANAPVSIYYTDSLGYYQSVMLSDQTTVDDSNVKFRLLDLSPDAGTITYTVNEKKAADLGFPATLIYRQATPYLTYSNPKTDTLRINFYQQSNTSAPIASAFLTATPGRSYTLALHGYFNQGISYQDPKNGSYLNIIENLAVKININN